MVKLPRQPTARPQLHLLVRVRQPLMELIKQRRAPMEILRQRRVPVELLLQPSTDESREMIRVGRGIDPLQ
jgi:hypothetical protein